jgi:hypothetical protein
MIKSSYTGIPDSMLRHEYQVSPHREHSWVSSELINRRPSG